MVIHFCFYRKSKHLIFSKSFSSAHLGAKDDCLAPIGTLANCHKSSPTLCQRARTSSMHGLTRRPSGIWWEATWVLLLSSCHLPSPPRSLRSVFQPWQGSRGKYLWHSPLLGILGSSDTAQTRIRRSRDSYVDSPALNLKEREV